MTNIAASETVVRRSLLRSIARVRGHLERRASALAEGRRVRPRRARARRDGPAVEESRVDVLCARFFLTDFERDLLLLCAGVELDARVPALCAALHGEASMPYVTFGLARTVLPAVHWSAIAPSGPLRRWRILHIDQRDGLTCAPLRIDERVLHFLLGVPCTDERVAAISQPVALPESLPPSQRALATEVAAALLEAESGTVVQLSGGDASDRAAIAAAACAALELRLDNLAIADVPAEAPERDGLLRACEREAVLADTAYFIGADELTPGAVRFLDSLAGVVIVDREEPLPLQHRGVRRFELGSAPADEQFMLWRAALGSTADRLNGQLLQVATHFRLPHSALQAAAQQAARSIDAGGAVDEALWDACRAQTRPRLADLAQHVETRARWDALVLPAAQIQSLRTIAAEVRQRNKVYEQWGFAQRSSRGLGVSALFSGASGTGKTLAAEVLASELRLDVYRVDLSALVSKYIGETEKNLRRVFDAAEQGGTILLFDEADALFGRRSDVKDSHDRYANIEVSYLLQRIETFRGLAILTTNMKTTIDSAFLRRLRFIVHFPFPDAEQRAEIWRRIYPAETPTEALDPEKLARLNLSGGNIRNLALSAAFLAADVNEPVRMTHLLAAAGSEYAKLERTLADAEVEGWV